MDDKTTEEKKTEEKKKTRVRLHTKAFKDVVVGENFISPTRSCEYCEVDSYCVFVKVLGFDEMAFSLTDTRFVPVAEDEQVILICA